MICQSRGGSWVRPVLPSFCSSPQQPPTILLNQIMQSISPEPFPPDVLFNSSLSTPSRLCFHRIISLSYFALSTASLSLSRVITYFFSIHPFHSYCPFQLSSLFVPIYSSRLASYNSSPALNPLLSFFHRILPLLIFVFLYPVPRLRLCLSRSVPPPALPLNTQGLIKPSDTHKHPLHPSPTILPSYSASFPTQ